MIQKQEDTQEKTIYDFIEKEINAAKDQLLENPDKQLANQIHSQILEAWDNIKNKHCSQTTGGDKDLRPKYVIAQGLIEKALGKALEAKNVTSVDVYIIAPKMPTPLLLESSKGLSEIDFTKPIDLSCYRNGILKSLLNTVGFKLHPVFSIDAMTSLSDEEFENYTNIQKFNSFEHGKVLKCRIADFPLKMSGAIYMINGGKQYITVQTLQANQTDSKNHTWAIKFGSKAEERKTEVEKLLLEQGVDNLFMASKVK